MKWFKRKTKTYEVEAYDDKGRLWPGKLPVEWDGKRELILPIPNVMMVKMFGREEPEFSLVTCTIHVRRK